MSEIENALKALLGDSAATLVMEYIVNNLPD
jgi:hypothetical protein